MSKEEGYVRRPLRAGGCYPADVLRDEYGMNAENRPIITVNELEVPEHLRPLIPFVERWAIPCDVTRIDYFEKQPASDVAEFWYAVLPFYAAIREWLEAQPEKYGAWSEAAVHFSFLLTAHMDAYQSTDEEEHACRERFETWRHRVNLKTANETAYQAFRAKDYDSVVEALNPFHSELSKVMTAKLHYAQKKVTEERGTDQFSP